MNSHNREAFEILIQEREDKNMQKRNTAEKKIKGFMKKGLILGMVAMMAVSATACGGNDSKKSSNKSITSTSSNTDSDKGAKSSSNKSSEKNSKGSSSKTSKSSSSKTSKGSSKKNSKSSTNKNSAGKNSGSSSN